MEMEEIKRRVTAVFSTTFRDITGLDENTSAKDIREWDSLKHIMLITAIEKEFGIRFGLDDMLNMRTFGDICRAVEKNHHA